VELLTVRLGKTVRADEEGSVKVGVRSITKHPEMNVAILTLDRPVTFTDQVRAIRLPDSEGEDFTGQTATLAAGGVGAKGELMKKADLKIVASSMCGQRGRAGRGGVPEEVICATSPVGSPPPMEDLNNSWRTGCRGDAGAPLFVCPSGPLSCTVVGVVVGPGPGDTSCAGDSTGPRVSALLPWIRGSMTTSTTSTTPTTSTMSTTPTMSTPSGTN
jgi:hypothetical protein